MITTTGVQDYINNFRRRLSPFLRPGIGLGCVVHPADSGGAILEFTFGPHLANDDTFRPALPTLGKALAGIKQRAFGGNLEGFTFGGTNYILESDRIILIKDDSPSEWNDAAAVRDSEKLLRPNSTGSRK